MLVEFQETFQLQYPAKMCSTHFVANNKIVLRILKVFRRTAKICVLMDSFIVNCTNA